MTAGRRVNSTSQSWCTPPKYVDAVTEALGGTVGLDPCSNKHSVVKATRAYSFPDDGLVLPWDAATIYVNPPYGKDHEVNAHLKRCTTIADWLRRCADAARESEVIALVPVAPNTRHWKDSVWPCATAIAFLYDTRLRFLVDGSTSNKGAPMACCTVYWGKHLARFSNAFKSHGRVVSLQP